MKMRLPKALPLILSFALGSALMADDRLVDPEVPARSPEGQKELETLQKQIVIALNDSRIEKKYLAARKLAQLKPEEVNREILAAAIEGLRHSNVNYRWYVAHQLKRLSGEDYGISVTAWREWVSERYRPAVREVAHPKSEGSEGSGSDRARPHSHEMSSGSQGHDNSGGIPAHQVPPSPGLGHDPNDPGVGQVEIKKMESETREGAGSMRGMGMKAIPTPPPEDPNNNPRGEVVVTNVAEDARRAREAQQKMDEIRRATEESSPKSLSATPPPADPTPPPAGGSYTTDRNPNN